MRDHKSLIAWQRARQVTLGVLDLSKHHWQPRASAIFAQLQRSSLSVQLNIAEGHALRAPARFRYHLTIALGSAVETVELLELGIEADVLPADTGREVLEKAIESRALLYGLLRRYRRVWANTSEPGANSRPLLTPYSSLLTPHFSLPTPRSFDSTLRNH